MTERRHSTPGRIVKGEEPEPTTDAGLLLQAIRDDGDGAGAWYLVEAQVSPMWWLRAGSAPLRELERRGLIRYATETVAGWRANVFARALDAQELGELRCVCDGYAMSMGGPHDPQCPTHGHGASR